MKLKHHGILNFIENYNFYGIIKTNKNIYVQLYKNLSLDYYQSNRLDKAIEYCKLIITIDHKIVSGTFDKVVHV